MFSPKRSKVKLPIFRVDGWMNRRTAQNRAMGCMCSGYGWEGNMTGAMHRRGSKRCWYRSNGEQRSFGDADFYMEPEVEVAVGGLTEVIDHMYGEMARLCAIPADMLRGDPPPQGFDAVDEDALRRWRRQFGLV